MGAPVQRGIVTYELSPFEQRAFAGFLKEGLPNMFRRATGQAFYIVVPLGLAYGVYMWGSENHGTRLDYARVVLFLI